MNILRQYESSVSSSDTNDNLYDTDEDEGIYGQVLYEI